MWADLLLLAIQLAEDSKRDGGVFLPRCIVNESVDVLPTEYYWRRVSIIDRSR